MMALSANDILILRYRRSECANTNKYQTFIPTELTGDPTRRLWGHCGQQPHVVQTTQEHEQGNAARARARYLTHSVHSSSS